MSAIAELQDRAIKEAEDAGQEMFLGIPDAWYEPSPEYGCDNGHTSRRYLKCDKHGPVCFRCHLPIAILPHGYTDETLKVALDGVRAAIAASGKEGV